MSKGRILKRIIAAVMLVAVFFSIAPATVAEAKTTKNLLVNGNAEKGTLKGWKASTDKWKACPKTQWGGTCMPYKGKYFFRTDKDYSNTTTLYQNVSINNNYIGKNITLSAYVAVWNQNPTDIAKLKITFYNSKGEAISSYSKSHSKAVWKKISLTKKIPKETKKVRVSLCGTKKNGEIDAYFDNVSLTIKY